MSGRGFWAGSTFLLGFAAVLLFVYSRFWKRALLVGNLVVAALIAAVLLYGGWAVGAPEAAGVGAFFAFLTTLAREIVKDVEDVPGDAAADARTLAVVIDEGTFEELLSHIPLPASPAPNAK